MKALITSLLLASLATANAARVITFSEPRTSSSGTVYTTFPSNYTGDWHSTSVVIPATGSFAAYNMDIMFSYTFSDNGAPHQIDNPILLGSAYAYDESNDETPVEKDLRQQVLFSVDQTNGHVTTSEIASNPTGGNSASYKGRTLHVEMTLSDSPTFVGVTNAGTSFDRTYTATVYDGTTALITRSITFHHVFAVTGP